MSNGLLALLATSAPLAAFVLALLVFARARALAAFVTISAGTLSLGAAALLLQRGPQATPVLVRWFSSESSELAFGFLLDGQNLLMGVVVATIALAIQVYSLGYMAGDRGWSRYYALMGLFAWSMLSFVYSANLMQMFVFWELVGLASFLLIGFWYEKPEAAAAARKAFVMTRIGDVGLFIGLILLYQQAGTLDVAALGDKATLALVPATLAAPIALLFFCGVVGKSAQFPLHTWLPDAMEGPTPVSALLHSATMVAAGVFLFARFHQLFTPIFDLVLAVAAFTAILSATVAMVQRDIKRVLAYSSISQLGFMLLGLAAGSEQAGVFHLTTHAFFKALLFLCAGYFIHHVGSNDLVTIGRQRGRRARLATIGLIVGAAALAGIPPFAGFFSKETILHALGASRSLGALAAAYLASFLTAYYSFRMVFLVTRPRGDSALAEEHLEAAGHAHHAHPTTPLISWAMKLPLAALTLAALAVGFAGDGIAALIDAVPVHPKLAEMVPPVSVALGGVLLAWIDFGRRSASQRGFIAHVPALEQFFRQRWYVDEVYDAVFGGLVRQVTRVCAAFEKGGLDGLADGVAGGTVGGGRLVSRAQGGTLQLYIGVSVLFAAVACYLLGAGS